MPTPDHITAGFLPLLDSAVLVAAVEKGFAVDQGISLGLVRETSWANIRDRIAVGHFDVAHMLAPMPIAANLKLTPLAVPLVAPMALGVGGNAVTVSLTLWHAMAAAGADGTPAPTGSALKAVVAERAASGEPRLQFAVVHPHSGHNFELRYWLAACGIDPDHDIDILVVPPPLMVDALQTGRIDGYCVGEPWNSLAVAAGAGRIATVKAAIWKSSPEKVLGVRTDWASAHGDLLTRLLRALYDAARWCGLEENRAELAAMLARSDYLDQPEALLAGALSGNLDVGEGQTAVVRDFFVPFDKAATFPWQSHALWFYSQMVRWGQVAHTSANAETARRSYRPDLYRAALKPLGVPLPGANAKVEGALATPTHVGTTSGTLTLGPDGFFDNTIFDPDQIDAYVRSQAGQKRG